MSWLPQEGSLSKSSPIVDVVTPRDFIWQWQARSWIRAVAVMELGYLTANRVEEIREMFRRVESDPDTRMITPGVLEIIATRL